MLLAELTRVGKHLSRAFDDAFPKHLSSLYYLRDSVWRDLVHHKPAPATESAQMSAAIATGSALLAKGASILFVPLPAKQAVLRVECPNRPVKRTRDRMRTKVNELLNIAQNEWDVSHDRLSGLEGRELFDRNLEEMLADTDAALNSAEATAKASIQHVVAVIALDLDHFKQVNDSYGHLYGDLVLAVTARRLTNAALKIAADIPEIESIAVSRPSGEEFLVAVHGRLADTDVSGIAERVRLAISEIYLPTDQELSELKAAGFALELALPPVSERRITVSVGYSVARVKGAASVSAWRERLRTEADAALMRAKTCGRNRVVPFADIKQRFGRVIDVHKETGIVAVDLGLEVRARKGEEYAVYHPDFFGDRDFVRHDGRTQKRLGRYPRYSTAKIVLFEVQPEVSFAHVQRGGELAAIVADSRLELVPLGSFVHHLRLPQNPVLPDGTGISSRDELENALSQRALELTGCVVVGLTSPETLAEKLGPAAVNASLARAFEALREVFAAAMGTAQVSPTDIAVVVQSPDGLKARIAQLVAKLDSQTTSKGMFFVGSFDGSASLRPGTSQFKLRPSAAIEYAQYALMTATEATPNVEFSEFTPSSVIYRSRSRGEYSRGIADMRRLEQLGCETPELYNQGALCLYEAKDPDHAAAEELARRALSLAPSDSVIRANLGLIQLRAGRRSDAMETISAADPTVLPAAYLGFFASEISDEDLRLKSMRQFAQAVISAFAKLPEPSKTSAVAQAVKLLEVRVLAFGATAEKADK